MNFSELDPESFSLKPCNIGGDECVLIIPKDITAKWTKETLNYRSVIVRKSDGLVVSHGLPKFFNYGEQPHLYPAPESCEEWVVEDKLDGSLCLISKHNGQLIVRTRGVVDAFQHDSGPELKALLDANPLITDNQWVNKMQTTLLFEHLSVVNPIVLKYPEPKLVLVGAIDNKESWDFSGELLDYIAKVIGVDRPEKFEFDNLADIIKNCETLKGREGYVLKYRPESGSKSGIEEKQYRVKLKGTEYLFLHKAKSQISSLDKVIDLFLESNTQTYEQFYSYVESHLDHELAEIAKDNIKETVDLSIKAAKVLSEIQEVVNMVKDKPRKDAALRIIGLYGGDGLTSYAFNMLNGKEIEKKHLKDLILKLRK